MPLLRGMRIHPGVARGLWCALCDPCALASWRGVGEHRHRARRARGSPMPRTKRCADLVRARATAERVLAQARQHLQGFLLRHDFARDSPPTCWRNLRQSSMGFGPENQVRNRLTPWRKPDSNPRSRGHGELTRRAVSLLHLAIRLTEDLRAGVFDRDLIDPACRERREDRLVLSPFGPETCLPVGLPITIKPQTAHAGTCKRALGLERGSATAVHSSPFKNARVPRRRSLDGPPS